MYMRINTVQFRQNSVFSCDFIDDMPVEVDMYRLKKDRSVIKSNGPILTNIFFPAKIKSV